MKNRNFLQYGILHNNNHHLCLYRLNASQSTYFTRYLVEFTSTVLETHLIIMERFSIEIFNFHCFLDLLAETYLPALGAWRVVNILYMYSSVLNTPT